MKTKEHMESQARPMRLTAAEKRFVHEVRQMCGMTLQELLMVEKMRAPIGV